MVWWCNKFFFLKLTQVEFGGRCDNNVYVFNLIILPVTYVKSRSKPSFLYLRLFWETCQIKESK